jgi:hypothetical protein
MAGSVGGNTSCDEGCVVVKGVGGADCEIARLRGGGGMSPKSGYRGA